MQVELGDRLFTADVMLAAVLMQASDQFAGFERLSFNKQCWVTGREHDRRQT